MNTKIALPTQNYFVWSVISAGVELIYAEKMTQSAGLLQ